MGRRCGPQCRVCAVLSSVPRPSPPSAMDDYHDKRFIRALRVPPQEMMVMDVSALVVWLRQSSVKLQDFGLKFRASLLVVSSTVHLQHKSEERRHEDTAATDAFSHTVVTGVFDEPWRRRVWWTMNPACVASLL